ncbi:MAG: glycosyltransferase [Erysipelotrichaceae bacterium]
MEIVYVSKTCDEKSFSRLYDLSLFPLEQQAQKFNSLIIKGLSLNEVKVRCISSIPVSKFKMKRRRFKLENIEDGNSSFFYLTYHENRIIKLASNFITTFVKAMSMKKDDVLICDSLCITIAFAALLAAKIKRMRSVAIVTDLPMFISKGITSRINKFIINRYDSYIVMTKYMMDKLPKKPYLVMEGICDVDITLPKEKVKAKSNVCLYTGGVYEKYGIKTLIDAFELIGDKLELNIYGNGDYVEQIRKRSLPNVKYCGTLLNKEIILKQQEAAVLINPRPTTEEFSKYSFPSKILEYMLSGTPTVTTKMQGMPIEYYPFLYLLDKEDKKSIAEVLLNVVNEEDSNIKGLNAKKYVISNKNCIIQAKNILAFVYGMKGDSINV